MPLRSYVYLRPAQAVPDTALKGQQAFPTPQALRVLGLGLSGVNACPLYLVHTLGHVLHTLRAACTLDRNAAPHLRCISSSVLTPFEMTRVQDAGTAIRSLGSAWACQ